MPIYHQFTATDPTNNVYLKQIQFAYTKTKDFLCNIK